MLSTLSFGRYPALMFSICFAMVSSWKNDVGGATQMFDHRILRGIDPLRVVGFNLVGANPQFAARVGVWRRFGQSGAARGIVTASDKVAVVPPVAGPVLALGKLCSAEVVCRLVSPTTVVRIIRDIYLRRRAVYSASRILCQNNPLPQGPWA